MSEEEQTVADFEDWDDVVLYDVFAEAWTRLDGWLIAREDRAEAAGDMAAAAAWRDESFARADKRRAIAPTAPAAQAAPIARWDARTETLDGSGADGRRCVTDTEERRP